MQFDFGRNWAEFSRKALTPEHVEQARTDFYSLMEYMKLQDKSFLDIGFGQGLSLLIAAESGAQVVGLDINPRCAEVLAANRKFFSSLDIRTALPVVVGSILDPGKIALVRQLSNRPDHTFDVVHSWGVLHHTGALWQALENAISLTAPGGLLVAAIYNTHWSSPWWKIIKRAFARLPRVIQRASALALCPGIALAKALVTRENPFRQERGMDFYYDVIDWVCGYPYEYATLHEVASFLEKKGFSNRKTIPASVPTGCNQFVYQRTA